MDGGGVVGLVDGPATAFVYSLFMATGQTRQVTQSP